MNKRLATFIDFKTGGNQKEFARLMGWSPQYLHKMLKGDSMGIQPVVSLLHKFPELNARWLILGEGFMFEPAAPIMRKIAELYRIELYMPVMSREELNALLSGKTDFDEATISRWKTLLGQKEAEIRQHFDDAYKRQAEQKTREIPVNTFDVTDGNADKQGCIENGNIRLESV